MPRYIDADEVLKEVKALTKSPWYNDDYGFGTKQARHDGVATVVDLCIRQMPTADVAEVKHGEWIDKGWGIYECSECGYQEDFTGRIDRKHKYCPNCGAKMNGKEE